jgi:D-cysteine desulfhydrase
MKILKPVKLITKTPIQLLEGLKIKTRIYIKRDDLNGLLISGNKARKMEYLIADAQRKRCDTIITCGPVQSNHCRTAVVFAKHFGFHCHLFLRGKPGKKYTGNILIDKLLDAKITYITPSQYKFRDEIMAEYAMKLKKLDFKPYIIPEGGSNEIGALGYLDCMKEMAGFIKKNRIDAIYCAVGSGGTYAGLLLGKKLLKINVALKGVIVADTVEYFKDKILSICERAIDRFKISIKVNQRDISLVDGFVGQGYGIPYPEELNTIRQVAKLGIILEPVYTGKTFYGMLKNLRNKRYKKVIFIHTGGIFSIFAFDKDLTKVIRSNWGRCLTF